MRRFLAGFLIVCGALTATSLLWPPALFRVRTSGGDVPRLIVSLCLLPTLAAGGVAGVIHGLRPRRVLDRQARRSARAFLLGSFTALLCVVITAALLLLLEPQAGDQWLPAVSAAIATPAILLSLSRRRRPGLCIQCNYDIQGSLAFGRCPECGATISA